MFGVSTFAGAPFAAQAGSSFSESIQEAGAANDVVSSLATLVGLINEAGTGADVVSSLGVQFVNVAESGTASDVVSETLARVGLIQETVQIVATPDSSLAYPSMFSDGVEASDVVLGVLSIDVEID